MGKVNKNKFYIIKIFFYNIVISFIERNQKIKTEIQENFSKKNKDSEKRHEKNIIEVNKENEKLAKETEEKEFKKYITYYFLKKGQSQNLSKKKKERSNKLQEKAEKLEELDRKNEERRKQIVKKMQKMDKRRDEYMKLKEEKILEDKLKRDAKTKSVHQRLNEMELEEFERRKDVLEYQTELMNRSIKLSNLNNKKRINTVDNSIANQIAIQKNLTAFNRKLNILKSQSVTKKTQEEKMKIFRELKRQEAERRKKEKEDEMYNKGQ